MTTVKLNTQFYSVFIDISSWKDTPQQRLQIVQLYYENGRSVKSVYRALRPIYGVHNRPAEGTIRHTIGKLENTLTLLDDTRLIRPRTARTVENIAAVNESFAEDREESIRRRSQQLGLSNGTTWVIFDAGN